MKGSFENIGEGDPFSHLDEQILHYESLRTRGGPAFLSFRVCNLVHRILIFIITEMSLTRSMHHKRKYLLNRSQEYRLQYLLSKEESFQ